MDRVKAAIFSSLGEAIIGARVLDLFAGTGALGIEAISRGASMVTFADSDRRSYVDLNRAGTPLIEIVTEPDLRCAKDAAKFPVR